MTCLNAMTLVGFGPIGGQKRACYSGRHGGLENSNVKTASRLPREGPLSD